MVKHISRGLVMVGLLAGLATVMVGADAATSYHYDTALTQQFGSIVPFTGTLDLNIDSSGIVNGYYHPSDSEATFITVTGGRQGDSIWMDIGRKASLRVSGKFDKSGAILGQAIGSHPTNDPITGQATAIFTFTATPSKKRGT